MTISPAPAHVGTLACHICGGPVHSDYDPKRKGWLACDRCGPVYMPLDGRYIQVHIACGLSEAAERVARLIVGLERAMT